MDEKIDYITFTSNRVTRYIHGDDYFWVGKTFNIEHDELIICTKIKRQIISLSYNGETKLLKRSKI